MKFFIVLIAFVAVVSAAKVKKPIHEYFSDFAGEEDIHLITDEDERPPTNFVGDVMKAKTTNSKNIVNGRGKFNYNFETQNGINIASIGKLKDEKTFVVSGSYAYTGADGKRYRVRYTADEFGYHPRTELDDQPEIEITQPPPTTRAPVSFATLSTFNGYGAGFGAQNPNANGNGNGFASPNGNAFGSPNGNAFGSPNGNAFGSPNGNGLGLQNRNGFGSPNSLGNNGNSFNAYTSYERTGKSIDQNSLVFNQNFVSARVPEINSPSRTYLPVPTAPPTPNRYYLPAAQTAPAYPIYPPYF